SLALSEASLPASKVLNDSITSFITSTQLNVFMVHGHIGWTDKREKQNHSVRKMMEVTWLKPHFWFRAFSRCANTLKMEAKKKRHWLQRLISFGAKWSGVGIRMAKMCCTGTGRLSIIGK